MMKKTIGLATLLAATAVHAMPTQQEILEQMTGPNQPKDGPVNELCVKVTPYYLTSLTPDGVVGGFHSFLIDGMDGWANKAPKGDCHSVNWETKSCEVGFVKITSTAPISCDVPVAL